VIGIKVDLEKASYAFPIRQHGRYTVDREVFEGLAQSGLPQHTDGVCNRVPIRDLPDVWPANGLREKALEGGRIFLRDMASHGLEPLTELEGLVVIGPYKHRRFHAPQTVTGSNPMFSTTGERQDDDLDPGAADFILEGHFLEKRGRIIEYDDHKG
jgi:hypothetical protein